MDKSAGLPSDIALRTRWYVFLHWYLLIALALSGLISIAVSEGMSQRFLRVLLLSVLAVSSNFIFYYFARQKRSNRYFQVLAAALVSFDILLVVATMYLNGGLESQSPLLFVVPLLMSAFIFGTRAVYITAAAIVCIFSLQVMADYFGWISSIGELTSLGQNTAYVVNTVIFIDLIVLLIGFLASYLLRLLQQKERLVSANNEALARAQALVKLGSWEWNIKDDDIAWSEQLYRMFGIRKSAKISYETYLNRIYPDDRKLVVGSFFRTLKTGRPFKMEHRIIGAGKKVRVVHSEGYVSKTPQGEPIKMFGTARDITDEWELDVAKSDFVSIASHQLRTPATGVKVLLSLLKDGYAGSLSEEQHEILEKAYSTNERQIKTANDLLDVARIESGRMKLHKKMLEVNSWISQIVAAMQPNVAEKDQQLSLSLPKQNLRIPADAERLRLAIENVIDNASKYTPKGGSITVSVSSTPKQVTFAIKDSGIGMSKKDTRSIFDIYTRLDNRLNSGTEGSGLGLYLVKNIIDLHKGTVRVSSRPGVGTTFRLSLPR